MKRITVNLIISVLTFACGLSVGAVWNWANTVKNEQHKVIERSTTTPTATSIPEPAPTPDTEIVFGRDRRRIVTDEIQLQSERLRYDIGVRYPQIVGSEDRHIRKLNQRFKQLAIKQYQWHVAPTKEDLQYYKVSHPEAFNSLSQDYEVLLANDSILSIYFNAYSYGIGAAHSVQYSYVINYDLVSGKELKLAHLFKPGSKYLEFISRYCIDKLSVDIPPVSMFTKEIAPIDDNFKSWNFTRDGIRFNFDACKLTGCAGGEYEVEIPYADMKKILNQKMSSLKQLGV